METILKEIQTKLSAILAAHNQEVGGVRTSRPSPALVEDLKIEAEVEEILIDSEEKAKKYQFVGSPTIRINGKDIQEDVSKDRCLPCEESAKRTEKATEFIKQECSCGCRIYFYRSKQYPYPPKEMIKEAIKKRT